MTELSDKIQKALLYISFYIPPEVDNWLRVKKELLWSLPAAERKKFSTRHYSTKKHSLNDVEMAIINWWYSKTGTLLKIPPAKAHDPKWVRHKRGWALKKLNHQRRQNANRKKQRRKQKASRGLGQGNGSQGTVA